MAYKSDKYKQELSRLVGANTNGLVLLNHLGEAAINTMSIRSTNDLLDLPFLMSVSESNTLAVVTVVDSRDITISAAHGLTTGNDAGKYIEITEGNFFYQSRIISVAGDVITMDSPMNHVYPVGSIIYLSTSDMRVDGSTVPKVFTIKPTADQMGYFSRCILTAASTTVQDFTTLGGISALSVGCLLRVKVAGGSYNNIINFKSNGDWIERAFGHTFLVNNGNNVRSFISAKSFEAAGADVHLSGLLEEELQLVIQDDLTSASNTVITMTAQGTAIDS